MTTGWERKLRRSITFTDRDGRFNGKVEVVERASRGNRHFNARRPDGPVCECGAPWRPICTDYRCPGSKVPRAMMRSEKQDAGTKRYSGHPALEPKRQPKARPQRRESPTRAVARTASSQRQRPSDMTAKLEALEAKYGGRHGKRAA